jgi:peptide/nickel transport system permease protein
MSSLVSNLFTAALIGALAWGFWRARQQPLWVEAWYRLRHNRLAMIALTVIVVYFGIGVLDSISWKDRKTSDPRTIVDRIYRPKLEHTYSAPFARRTTGEPRPHVVQGKHLLGTDAVGTDVLYATLKGCRTALIIAVLTTLIATPLALVFGLLAGYFGKGVDDLIQYIYTTLHSIPTILLLITLLMVMGRGLLQICLALGIAGWVGLCRLVRGETLKHRERDYVRAARALGVGPFGIMFRHILPNILPLVIISVTLSLSGLILTEVILAYLGLGVEPGVGSWGAMIEGARLEFAREPIVWWNLAAAFAAAFTLALALNLFGDALRDAIDPRLRGLEGAVKNG